MLIDQCNVLCLSPREDFSKERHDYFMSKFPVDFTTVYFKTQYENFKDFLRNLTRLNDASSRAVF